MLRGKAVRPLHINVSVLRYHQRFLSTTQLPIHNETERPRSSSHSSRFQRKFTPSDVVEVSGARSRAVFVKTWDGIASMAHVFAIIAEIEKRFGRITDYTVPRDGDVRSAYAPYIHATFERDKDVAAIPPEGKVLQVPEPPTHEIPFGGLGIRDIQDYIDAAEREIYLVKGALRRAANQEVPRFPENVKVIDVKIERADTSKQELLQNTHSIRNTQYRTADAYRTQELAREIVTFGNLYAGIKDASKKSDAPLEQLVARWAWKLPKASARHLGVKQGSSASASTSGSFTRIPRAETSDLKLEGENEGLALDATGDTVDMSSTRSQLLHTEPPSSSPNTPSHAPEASPSPFSTSTMPTASTSTSSTTATSTTSTLESTVAPKRTPKPPTLTKRERMLLAARQAGAAEVLRLRQREPETSDDVDLEPEAGGKMHEGSTIRNILNESVGVVAGQALEARVERRGQERRGVQRGAEGPPPPEKETIEEAKSWWKSLLGRK